MPNLVQWFLIIFCAVLTLLLLAMVSVQPYLLQADSSFPLRSSDYILTLWSDLLFSHKSALSITHAQNIICSKTHLNVTTHEQTITCRSRGVLSVNEKEGKMHRMITSGEPTRGEPVPPRSLRSFFSFALTEFYLPCSLGACSQVANFARYRRKTLAILTNCQLNECFDKGHYICYEGRNHDGKHQLSCLCWRQEAVFL